MIVRTRTEVEITDAFDSTHAMPIMTHDSRQPTPPAKPKRCPATRYESNTRQSGPFPCLQPLCNYATQLPMLLNLSCPLKLHTTCLLVVPRNSPMNTTIPSNHLFIVHGSRAAHGVSQHWDDPIFSPFGSP
jgi:hypothetical protein